jgi:hypothetical protein
VSGVPDKLSEVNLAVSKFPAPGVTPYDTSSIKATLTKFDELINNLLYKSVSFSYPIIKDPAMYPLSNLKVAPAPKFTGVTDSIKIESILCPRNKSLSASALVKMISETPNFAMSTT